MGKWMIERRRRALALFLALAFGCLCNPALAEPTFLESVVSLSRTFTAPERRIVTMPICRAGVLAGARVGTETGLDKRYS